MVIRFSEDNHLFASFEGHAELAASELCGFIKKNEWPANCPDLNPLDNYVCRIMLERYHKLQPKPKATDSLKSPCRLSGKSCHKNTSTRRRRRRTASTHFVC